MEKETKNPKKENLGGRRFWYPSMKEVDRDENEIDENFQPEEEAKNRLKKLEGAINVIQSQLTEVERLKIKAIILFGSTAREALTHPDADIDIHIDLEPYDDDLFRKIKNIISEEIPNIDLDFTSKNIKGGSRTIKLLTTQKDPDRPVKWKFLYSRSDQEKSELNNLLSEKHKD